MVVGRHDDGRPPLDPDPLDAWQLAAPEPEPGANLMLGCIALVLAVLAGMALGAAVMTLIVPR